MPWTRRSLRGAVVYVRARTDGTPELDASGRVDVKYRPSVGAKLYRAYARNLGPPPDDGAPDLVEHLAPGNGPGEANGPDPATAPAPRAGEPSPAADPVVVYTDGACSGNPGPMGIGVVILRGRERREIGEYLGIGTNNIAELTAIERALDALPDEDRERPVLVHVDSQYAIGLLAGGHRAKANVDLVMRLREKIRRFPRLRFVKVEGHAGVPENERCDALAREAIVRRNRA